MRYTKHIELKRILRTPVKKVGITVGDSVIEIPTLEDVVAWDALLEISILRIYQSKVLQITFQIQNLM